MLKNQFVFVGHLISKANGQPLLNYASTFQWTISELPVASVSKWVHFHANQIHFHMNGFFTSTLETEAQNNSEMSYSQGRSRKKAATHTSIYNSLVLRKCSRCPFLNCFGQFHFEENASFLISLWYCFNSKISRSVLRCCLRTKKHQITWDFVNPDSKAPWTRFVLL